MKKLAIIILAIVLLAPAWALAEDQVIEATIQSATEAVDRNGNAYVRLIVNEERSKTINGVEHTYTVGVPLMCFGGLVSDAQKLSAGDRVTAIVQPREFQGRSSYTALKFLN